MSAPRSTDSPFTEIDRLRDPDDLGLVAPITIKTKANGYVSFSFAIFKEFEQSDGQLRRTSFLNDRHIDAAHKLLDAVEKRIELERGRAGAPARRRELIAEQVARGSEILSAERPTAQKCCRYPPVRRMPRPYDDVGW